MPEEVQALFREAETAQAQKDWDLAIEKYQAVMEEDPANEEACSKLAELYAIRGLISNVVDQYFVLMDILEEKEEFELAVEVARWIMKLQPDNDKARMKTILIYKKKGDMDEVVKQSLQLARLYIELGQGDQSILLLKNAQDIAPENLDIGLELAEMYISHGHIPEGTNQYKKIANAYLEKGNHEKAAESFRRMKVVQPDDPQLLFTLGNLYMSLGKYNEAEAEFRAILRHNLSHTDALMALGNVCQKKGQFRDAILAFNKILSVNPQDEIAKEKLGELYQAQGATSEAVKFYLQAANTYQYGDAVDRAIKLYQRVLTIDPTNPTACRELTNLGAPLATEEADEEAIKDAYDLKITPMEVSEEEFEMIDGPSLEEMAGVIVPPSETGIPKKASAARDKQSAKEKKSRGEAAPRGAVPSAFESAHSEEDVISFRQDTGSDLVFSEGRQEESDLVFSDDYSDYDEESDGDAEEAEDQVTRKPRRTKIRGLKKKRTFDKSAGKGLIKKRLSSKKSEDNKLLKPGLLSYKGAPKGKLSLSPKKGLLSKGRAEKGLFSRKEKDEKAEVVQDEMEVRRHHEVEEPQIKEYQEEHQEDYQEVYQEEEYPEEVQEEHVPEEMQYQEDHEEPEPYQEEDEQGFMSLSHIDEKSGEELSEQQEFFEEPQPEMLEDDYAEEYPSYNDYPEVETLSEVEPLESEMPEALGLPDLEPEPDFALEENEIAQQVSEDQDIGKKSSSKSLLSKKKKRLKSALKSALKKSAEPDVEEPEIPQVEELTPIEDYKPMDDVSPEPMMSEMDEYPEPIEEPQQYDDLMAMPLLNEDSAEAVPLDLEGYAESEFPSADDYSMDEMADLPSFDDELPKAMDDDFSLEEFPNEFSEDMDLPELDLSASDFGEAYEEPISDFGQKLAELPDLPEALESLEEVIPAADTPQPVLLEPSLGTRVSDTTPSADDFFSLSNMPSLNGEAAKDIDFDDFTSSLLRLADEIEDIIPDDERIKQAEEKKKAEEESLKHLYEQEFEGEEIPMAKSTSFLEMPKGLFEEEEEEEISLDSIPGLPDEIEQKVEEPSAAEEFPASHETVMLPPLEEVIDLSPPAMIMEEFEAPAEIEIIEEEEITAEVIEEPPPPEPEMDIEEKVRQYIEEGDLGKAFPSFIEALEKKPGNLELRRQYADLCYEYGKIEDAIGSYRIVLKHEPGNYEIRRKIIRGQLLHNQNEQAVISLLEYGNDLTAQDKVDEAQRVFQYVLALQKENSIAREALSEIYLNMDMKELALYHLNILAKHLEEQQSIEGAIKVLKKIIALTSNIQVQEKLTKVYIDYNYKKEAVEELVDLAKKYAQDKDFAKACANYEKVIYMEPDNLEAHVQLIDLYGKMGDKAKSYKEKVTAAELYIQQNNVEEAQKRLEECLAERNYDHVVRRKLVDIYLDNKKIEKALEESKILSDVYHKERRYDEAIELYAKLIDADYSNLSLKEKLSEFYIMSDQLNKGLQQLLQVAEELENRKDWDGAVKAYKKALTIDKNNADIHYKIARIYLEEKKNPTEARFEFARVYELDATHRRAMEHLVRLYLGENIPAKAIQILKKLIDLDSSYKTMQTEIINQFQKKIDENPEDTKAHFNLGIIYKELEMWTKAIEQFQHTRKSDDYVLDSHVMLGVCFSQQPPMVNLAVKTLEKGLQLKGYKPEDYVELHYQLAVLHNSRKKYNEAFSEFQAVVAIDPHYKDAADLLKEVKKKIENKK